MKREWQPGDVTDEQWLEVLSARLFLADPDRPAPGPWASLREGYQRPYRTMAQAALDAFRDRAAVQSGVSPNVAPEMGPRVLLVTVYDDEPPAGVDEVECLEGEPWSWVRATEPGQWRGPHDPDEEGWTWSWESLAESWGPQVSVGTRRRLADRYLDSGICGQGGSR